MINVDPSSPLPIAIIGIGCLFPKADNVESYWANLQNGVDAITEIPPTHWRPEDYFDADPKKADHTYATRGGFLSPVNFPALDFGISPNVLEATDTTQLLGLLAARQALESAGYGAGREFDRNRVSVILGVTGALELVVPLGARLGHPLWKQALQEAGVDEATAGEVMRKISDSYVGWQEDSFPGLLGNVAAGRIANRLDLGGTNCVVDAACASSLSALHLALLELTAGRSDMVITGGIDTFNSIFMYMCFSKTPALSPTGDSRPFDKNADGTILGEGLGCILLKRLADAERDGDRVFAVIRGIGTSSDGKGQAIYAPSPKGQAKALRQAYQLAGITPESIELVEAHGTGTRAGDAAEVTALAEVFAGTDRSSPWCALGSVKSQIGHTKAAAGVAGLIKAVLGLYHKVLPPTIKVTQPIEQIAGSSSPFYVNTQKRPWMPPPADQPRRAAVSAFGFGGSNFHCVLEEYSSRKTEIDWEPNVQILAFAASTPEELRERLAAFPRNLAWDDLSIVAARSRQEWDRPERCDRRPAGPDRRDACPTNDSSEFRLTIVVERGKKDPAELLDAAQAMLEKTSDKSSWSTPEGIFFGRGSRAGKLAMIFPGQGSQYIGMLRDLTCRWPVMHETLAQANASFAENHAEESRLSDFIYPVSVFSEQDRERHDAALRATDIAQPALGALSLGAFQILQHFAVRPEAVAGHSFGELTALGAAGWIDTMSLHKLSQLRGRLMANGTGDRGGMLAVNAPIHAVEAVLHEEQIDLVLANRNAANQVVLSGATDRIARAREVFARRQIVNKPLAVAAAFHTAFVADARQPFQDALETVAFHPTDIAVFANSTAQEYPHDPERIRSLLAGQLAEPVEFMSEIDNMYRAGVRTFLEIGPGNKLSGLIGSILTGRPHAVLTLDASSGKRSGTADLARVLAQLAVLGHGVTLSCWDAGQADRKLSTEKKPTLTVPICGANYVKPREDNKVQAPLTKAPAVSANGAGAIDKAIRRQGDTVAEENRKTAAENQKMIRPYSDNGNGFAAAPLSTSLAMTQENLVALQKLSEQTAQLHRQFLEGQDRALQVFQSLVDQQQRLFLGNDQGLAPVLQQAPQLQVDRKPEEPVHIAPRWLGSRYSETPDHLQPQPASSSTETSATAMMPTKQPMAVFHRHVETTLLNVVAAKTGYPAEMLQLDMELDTDLGIDSIKRVEIFALLQEKLPDAPPVKAEHLGTLRTLRQVVGFLANGADLAKNRQRAGNVSDGHAQENQPLPLPARHGAALSSVKGDRRPGIPEERATVVLLEVVSQKTGYPSDMLQLDMELDTDLGIDSIKRVEIFALVQEKLPDAPTVKAEHLGTLRTLRQVVDFIAQSPNQNGSASEKPPPLGPNLQEQLDRRPTHQSTDGSAAVESPVSEAPANTVQRSVLRPAALDKKPRLSAPLPTGGEVWITAEWTELAMRLARRLDLLGYKSRLVTLKDVRDLAKPVILAGLVMLALPGGVNAGFFFEALQLLQLAAAGLRSSGKAGSSVFMTVSRQGGSFGVDNLPPGADPLSGGLAGLAKTARHEWPEVHCKAVDLALDWEDLDQTASALVEEMLLYGPDEIGLSPGGRCALELAPTPPHPAIASPSLAPGDVVVVTGGARGVTAEAAVALARLSSPTLVLLGRSPPPSAEAAWLATLSHESEIKQALFARLNGQSTPKEVERHYRTLAANREILRTLERIEHAGSQVYYRQVDVRHADQVRGLLAEIRHEFGPIRGLIHGAGVLADRLIEHKTVDQFEAVYTTKVSSLQAMLDALKDDELRLLALFSSSTARFGRAGQVDYAVANEILNKLAQREARARPGCKVVSINWGPWDGGMVNVSLKKNFENEGIHVISLQDGGEFFLREICLPPGNAVEIVAMAAPVGSGGTPISPVETGTQPGPQSRGSFAENVAFEQDLSVDSMPVLRSHVIKGHPVVPMALILEWLAHGALHAHPGLVFHGCDELMILKGVILTDHVPVHLRVLTGKATKKDGLYCVPVELRGHGASTAGRDIPHARADIVLATRLPALDETAFEFSVQPYLRPRDEIYDKLLFHGKDLQGIGHIEGCTEEGIVASVSCAPAPKVWIKHPMRSAWLADPLVLDSGFQLMVLWCFEQYGSGSLPTSLGRYRQYRRSFPVEGVRVIARVTHRNENRALADLEFVDAAGKIIARLTDYESVIDTSLNQSFRENQLVAGS